MPRDRRSTERTPVIIRGTGPEKRPPQLPSIDGKPPGPSKEAVEAMREYRRKRRLMGY